MDGSCHRTNPRSQKRMTRQSQLFHLQAEAALPDHNLTVFDFYCLGTEIGGKAVFFSMQHHHTNDSGEVKRTDWNICHRQHQCAIRETTLRPGVFFGKRVTPVTLQIAHGIMKNIGNTVDPDFSVYTVMHTVNTVAALHEWNKLKRPHNIIFDGRERTEAERSGDTQFGSMQIQRDPGWTKTVICDTDLISTLLKIIVGKLCVNGIGVGDQLNGAKCTVLGFMNGWNHCQSLIVRLAAIILAAKVLPH